ncbi:hypothetical protein BD779DRAFT_741121 [Infundibulicybe gibba]|nr:hypothetical protein BD779DRAFT_741121 [Infundibulicybe gibba]
MFRSDPTCRASINYWDLEATVVYTQSDISRSPLRIFRGLIFWIRHRVARRVGSSEMRRGCNMAVTIEGSMQRAVIAKEQQGCSRLQPRTAGLGEWACGRPRVKYCREARAEENISSISAYGHHHKTYNFCSMYSVRDYHRLNFQKLSLSAYNYIVWVATDWTAKFTRTWEALIQLPPNFCVFERPKRPNRCPDIAYLWESCRIKLEEIKIVA